MSDTIEKENCPFCQTKTLELNEEEREIPYFGKVYILSMNCDNCHFFKSDVECVDNHGPVKIIFDVEYEDDLKVRLVKSAEAKVKLGPKMSMEPGTASIGFITNVEGMINRFERIVEQQRDEAEDITVKKAAKNLLKKIRKVKAGEDSIKIIIEDPSGNSAIVSDKAVVTKSKK